MLGHPILIFDGHLDLAANALYNRRDLTRPVRVLREREGGLPLSRSTHADSLERREGPLAKISGPPTVSLPELRAGNVGIVLASIFCPVRVTTRITYPSARSQAAAYAVGQSHLAYYRALEREGEIAFIRDRDELSSHLATWKNPGPETPVGVILTMESADPIMGPDQVQEWWDLGLRALSLTHFGANTYGHGTGSRGGLYPSAYPLMDAMRAAGIILDLAHLADLAFWDALEHWDGPVFVSHAVCRALVPGQRHLSDEMIKAVVERGGTIGMVFAEPMLNPKWDWDDPSTHGSTATRAMSAAIGHVDRICQIAGNGDHVAIGSDLDGGFGRELAPVDLDTAADLQRFLGTLLEKGFSESDIRKIAHGNMVRFFNDAWRKK